METNSGSSQPYTGLVLVPLRVLRMLHERWVQGWKKAQGNLRGKKKTRQKDNKFLLPTVHVLSVSLPSFLTPQGHLGPAGDPTQYCLHQSVRCPWKERTQ